MSIESVNERFLQLRSTIGARPLNALFPDDIELYVVSLELVNSNGDTEDYFVFPINPSSMSEDGIPIKSVKKTAGGISVMRSATFSPTDIVFQGNFGRKFKFLIGSEVVSFSGLRLKINSKRGIAKEFDSKIKTGYGCCKVLESIITRATQLDSNNKPYSLFLYNLALGNSYLVEPIGLKFYQSLDSNLIWNYNLTMKSLLKVEDIVNENKKALTTLISSRAAVQNSVNSISSTLTKVIKL